jgi:hypothetical protein
MPATTVAMKEQAQHDNQKRSLRTVLIQTVSVATSIWLLAGAAIGQGMIRLNRSLREFAKQKVD